MPGLTDAKQEEKEASEEKAAAAAAASTGKEPESANLKEVAEELSRLAQTVEGGLEIIQEKEAVVQKVSSRIAGDNTSGDATPSDDDNVTPGPSAATFPAASFTTIALAIVSGGAALLVAN